MSSAGAAREDACSVVTGMRYTCMLVSAVRQGSSSLLAPMFTVAEEEVVPEQSHHGCCSWRVTTHLGVRLPGSVSLDEDAAHDTLHRLQASVPLPGQQCGQGVHVTGCDQLLEPSIDQPGQQPSPPVQQAWVEPLC